jgi:hypothetical protein
MAHGAPPSRPIASKMIKFHHHTDMALHNRMIREREPSGLPVKQMATTKETAESTHKDEDGVFPIGVYANIIDHSFEDAA